MSLPSEFRLQPVLSYKSQMKDALEMEFARLKLAHQREQELLVALQQTAERELDTLCERQVGLIDCQDIQLRQDYLEALHDNVVQQSGRVEDAEQRADDKRGELVETMQDQKALEKLRDHHQARVLKEMDRREARAVDDIVTSRYGRENERHA
jgi:flagellar export protein FliJ